MNMGVAIGIVFFYYLIFGLPVFVVVALIVHFRFPTTIEQDLFNERHFTPYELKTFSSFPMSILKTLAFIRGTVAPSTIRKRFGNYDFRTHMSAIFYSLCVAYIILLFIGAVLSLMLAVYGIVITVSTYSGPN